MLAVSFDHPGDYAFVLVVIQWLRRSLGLYTGLVDIVHGSSLELRCFAVTIDSLLFFGFDASRISA
jgi:hypothetical protein